VLLVNNGLHVELIFDRTHTVGSRDQAGLADVQMESAVSAIMDCEDSVACVDADDKVLAYANWLGLMRGDLEDTFEKGGAAVTRRLNPDLAYTAPDGADLSVKGRALMLVRNVGHLMTNPAILTRDGAEIYEGLMDALVTVAIAMHDLARDGGNSLTGSVYVVKPKMHGPDEVAFTDEIFDPVEEISGCPEHREDRDHGRGAPHLGEPQGMHPRREKPRVLHQYRLSRPHRRRDPHLDGGRPLQPQGLHQAQGLDRRLREPQRRYRPGMRLAGPRPDRQGHVGDAGPMAAMLEAKIEHPKAGANCAWVPSPTAATLHALHYHKVDVVAVQRSSRPAGRAPMSTACSRSRWPASASGRRQEIRDEVENNAQGILGYVVRWIDQGVGCSKVPDIHNVGLMEDRATCRISAQHIANWLHHDVVSAQVMAAMRKMAVVVDGQNAGRPRLSADGARLRRNRLPGGLRSGVQGTGAAAGLYRTGAARAAAGTQGGRRRPISWPP
jgi:malate synthase